MSPYIVNGSPTFCLRCEKFFKAQGNNCWHDNRDGGYYCSETCADKAQVERLMKVQKSARRVN